MDLHLEGRQLIKSFFLVEVVSSVDLLHGFFELPK